ncbi:MAG TPA: hypothetical protein VFD43_00625, partial [Planctomycetota bacterium]|nr:hypothetical protein [Planctomycetota bacterium]
MTRHGPSGFAVVAVLILVGLIAMLGSAYARHVSLANRSSPAGLQSLRSGGAVASGLQYARQSLRTRGATASATLVEGSAAASIGIEDLGGDRGRLELRSVDSRGIGATLLFEIERAPMTLGGGPDDLPRLRHDALVSLLADAAVPKTWISGLATILDADLEGLVILEDGASLTVSGVCLRGCIVSERTLTDSAYGPYDVITAPALLIAGDLRITPSLALP